jgi:hypothetical protein
MKSHCMCDCLCDFEHAGMTDSFWIFSYFQKNHIFMPQTRSQRGKNAKKAPATPPPSNRQKRQQTPPSGVSTGSASSKGYNTKLDFVWKELCDDIEANGGIGKFANSKNHIGFLLNKLIQEDPKKRELYDLPNSQRREQIRKKVWEWGKFLKALTYKEKVLSRYGVKEFKYRRTTPSDSTIPSESETSLDWTDIADDISSSSNSDDKGEQKEEPALKQKEEPPLEQIFFEKMSLKGNRLPPGTRK